LNRTLPIGRNSPGVTIWRMKFASCWQTIQNREIAPISEVIKLIQHSLIPDPFSLKNHFCPSPVSSTNCEVLMACWAAGLMVN
jgi:hypothetical protein